MFMKKTWIYIIIVIIVVLVLIVVLTESEPGEESEESIILSEEELEGESQQPISLTEFEPISSYQDWGDLGINKSVGGNSLTVGGVEYEKGLGTHTVSEHKYAIKGAYSYFETDFGLDDEADCEGNVAVFIVKGDGQELYKSALIKIDQAAIHIKVQIDGIQELTLSTEAGGDDIACDHTNWLNPVLIK